jgi:hypothetical protein
MLNKELREATNTLKDETRVALQTVYDTLNQGQQKKKVQNIMKNIASICVALEMTQPHAQNGAADGF